MQPDMISLEDRSFCLSDRKPCFQYRIRVQANRINALSHQKLSEFGIVTRRLTANANLAIKLFCAGNHSLQLAFHGSITLIKQMGNQGRIPIQTQDQLGQVSPISLTRESAIAFPSPRRGKLNAITFFSGSRTVNHTLANRDSVTVFA